jgi:uncharacterized protein (DUF2147 family)
MKTLILILLFSIQAMAQSSDITGKWKTIDDETGKPKSIVEISKDGEVYKGKIVELINPEKPNPVCEKCKDERKDQPITGLEIIRGLKESEKGKLWEGGEILDPKNGKTYKVKTTLKENGEKLEVRGFVGFSLLGRSQTWERQADVATAPVPAPETTPVATPTPETKPATKKTKTKK